MGYELEKSPVLFSVCACVGWGAWCFFLKDHGRITELFYTSENQVSEYLSVNNSKKSSSPNSSLYIIFNVFKFKFYCFVCKYVDPGTVINEQKVTVQGSDSV